MRVTCSRPKSWYLKLLKQGDVFLTLGAGDVCTVGPRVMKALQKQAGQGDTNTRRTRHERYTAAGSTDKNKR